MDELVEISLLKRGCLMLISKYSDDRSWQIVSRASAGSVSRALYERSPRFIMR